MCHWKYFHYCKKTLNKWEKLVPGSFGDCKCSEEVDTIEAKACLVSCVLAGGYKPGTATDDPLKDETPPGIRKELREAVRDYKDGKVRATDLIKTFLERLGR
ncbi:uncharacterized protein DFL_008454 [Arthrobotrys flagrans]|uniref:Uncharacterized protein n=1 Tax=Arthrobotrys flagrans TaxID=97331 RepID=A0A436ZNV1_ARTFL|nr:hypothetical protein DFL_008454 [Arthrobotrys flagrans]